MLEDITGRKHENRITFMSNHNALIKVSSSRLPFTMATVIRAAWGLTTGSYSHTFDVSFLGILSGRNAPGHGIETMMGPALNYVPIRVPIQTFWTSTSTEILTQIHRGVLDAMPHEGLGIQAITEVNDDTARVWASLNNFLNKTQLIAWEESLLIMTNSIFLRCFLCLYIFVLYETRASHPFLCMWDLVLARPKELCPEVQKRGNNCLVFLCVAGLQHHLIKVR